MREIARGHIGHLPPTSTLKRCGGNKTRTAAMLGVSLKTLYNRLNAYRALDMADLPGERIEGTETTSSAEKIA